MAEFEAAYAAVLATLTEEDTLQERDAAVLRLEQEEKAAKFVELARSLETFFNRKRQLIHAHRPELVLKEETTELKQELIKKEELVRKHFEKLNTWQELLQDMQSQQPQQQMPQQQQQQQPQQQPYMRMLTPGAPMQPGIGAPQGGFVPGNTYQRMRMPPAGMPMMASSASSTSSGQDPLSYLEKTATSVGQQMKR